MMCENCYGKTKVKTTNESVASGVPSVSRSRVCTECGHKFNSTELPESAHKRKPPDPSNPGRTPFVRVEQ
jgi:transcriptional regulator NrdR family protein